MEINKFISKKSLFYICIIIVILIIIRISYTTFYTNIEGFDLNNNNATDLLSKYKSNDAQLNITPDNTNLEMRIYSWSNQIYNLQNQSSQYKALAFYKPNLTINKVQYAKLGDIVSQNSDYSLPSVDQFTLLVKKETSDIKIPIRFDKVAEINPPNFNLNFYAYSNYIGSSSNIVSIKDSLTNCSSAINNLNLLITNNLSIIEDKVKYNIYNNGAVGNKIKIGDSETPLINILKQIGEVKENYDDISTQEIAELSEVEEVEEVKENFDNGYNDFIPIATSPLVNNNRVINDVSKINRNRIPNTNIYKKNLNDAIFGKTIKIPVGISGNIIVNGQIISITIPSSIHKNQISSQDLKSKLPDTFGNVKLEQITYAENDTKIFSCIPGQTLINHILVLCNDIINIYNQSQSQNPTENLLKYLKLAPSIKIVTQIQTKLTSLAGIYYSSNINLEQIFIEFNSISGLNISNLSSTSTLIELVLYIIKYMSIYYYLPYITFNILDLIGIDSKSKVTATSQGCYKDNDLNTVTGLRNDFYRAIRFNIGDGKSGITIQDCANAANYKGYDTIGLQNGGKCYGAYKPDFAKYGVPDSGTVCSPLGSVDVNHVYTINNNSFEITGFNIDIPSSEYNILSTTSFSPDRVTVMNSIITYVDNFSDFITSFSNNTLGYFPLQIYKPIAPENYISLGHVFCNTSTDLQKIIDSNNVACVPSHCVKPIRDWTTNDKIFEYNVGGRYFAIYLNPYTGTFISTNVNSQTLPEGKVNKVVACVKKCTVVDDLVKSDECSRKYHNMNKKSISSTPLSSNLVSSQEEDFYLDKIKVQSDSITRLKQRAQQMQTDVDKSTIVNREMNKNKLQNHVDIQKRNIDIIMKRLQDDRNKIKTDINVPLDTLKQIIEMIRNSSLLNSDQKSVLLKKLASSKDLSGIQYNNNLNQVLGSCPQYDLEGLISKKTASDVCFGCDTPM